MSYPYIEIIKAEMQDGRVFLMSLHPATIALIAFLAGMAVAHVWSL